jgi:hypothetical protein
MQQIPTLRVGAFSTTNTEHPMKFAKALIIAFTLALFASPLAAQVFIDVEVGTAYTASNDVRIPGDTGTRFSLSDDLQADRVGFFRLRAGYTFGERHTMVILPKNRTTG